MQSLNHSRQRIGLVRISDSGLGVQADEALLKACVIGEQAGMTYDVQWRAVLVRKLGKIDAVDRQIAHIVDSRAPSCRLDSIFLLESSALTLVARVYRVDQYFLDEPLRHA